MNIQSALYGFIRPIHNINRYIVVVLIAGAIVYGLIGWLQKKEYTKTHKQLALFGTIFLDMQVLFGLILYFVSPLSTSALKDFGGAMSNATLRFYGLEHVFYGIIALTLAHIGSARVKKAEEAIKKHRTTVIFYGLALLVILAGMPWDRWMPFR